MNEKPLTTMEQYARQSGKAARLAAGYGMGVARMMQTGVWVHDELTRDTPATQTNKPQKPWKKGFIPTVGKQPELRAPQLQGWSLVERHGNNVAFERPEETNPFVYTRVRIEGNLAARQWKVVQRPTGPNAFGGEVLMTARNPEACVLYVALDGDLAVPDMPSLLDFRGSVTGRSGKVQWPMLTRVPKYESAQLVQRASAELYRAYCEADVEKNPALLYKPKP